MEIGAPRGSLLTTRWLALPFSQAIRFVEEHTDPGEDVATLPQASIVNFLGERPNPLKDEIMVPGFLTPEREADTITRLEQRRVRVILVAGWPTPEYRDTTFGVDYGADLMRWIESRYHMVAIFSDPDSAAAHGDAAFRIRAVRAECRLMRHQILRTSTISGEHRPLIHPRLQTALDRAPERRARSWRKSAQRHAARQQVSERHRRR